MRLRELPGFPSLYLDFVENAPTTRRLVSRPNGIDAVAARAIGARRRNFAYLDLVGCLRRQNARTEKTERNLDDIANADACVILVGCGPFLAGGPLSVLLKCLTAVGISEELAARGVRAVPVCTAAPESLGTAEEFRLANSDSRLVTVSMRDAADAAEIDLSLPDRLIAAIERALGRSLPQETGLLIRDSYSSEVSLAIGCARFHAKLLADWGVLTLDPLDRELSAIALRNPRLQDADALKFRPLLQSQQSELDRSGYCTGESAKWSEAELWGSFVTDLALESVLPVGCHVVDHVDVCRFALFAPLFPELGLETPLLWPRASATIMDARSSKTLERYGLALRDFFASDGVILGSLTNDAAGDEAVATLDRLAGVIETTLRSLKIPASAGESLPAVVGDSRKRMIFQVGKLKERFSAARLARRETFARQLERMRNTIAPGGIPQEMGLSCLHFLLRYSSAFPRILLEKLDIMQTDHQQLLLE